MDDAAKDGSLAEQAFCILQEQLVDLRLAPGDMVSEGDLIKLTGFGRTPVREAMQRLAQHELFEVIPRQGLRVSPVNREGLLQVLEVRAPLERLATRKAAMHANDEQRSELSAIARELARSHDNFERFSALSMQIEQLMNTCCDNAFLIQALSPLRIHCQRFWNYHRSHLNLSDVVAAHAHLMRLAARRDLKGAEKASDNIMQLMERLVSGLDQ